MHLGFEKFLIIPSVGSILNGKDMRGTVVNIHTLVRGVVGNAIYTNGMNQWVTFGSHKDRCFGNTSRCDQGFSLAFWLKLGERTENHPCKFILNSMDRHCANGFEVCWAMNKQLRVSVNFPIGSYIKVTKIVESSIWYHLGVTWSKVNGLTILLNGHFHRNTRDVTSESKAEWLLVIEVTLGASVRNPANTDYMSEVTVDEFYFWEKMMTKITMWKIYTRSIFGG